MATSPLWFLVLVVGLADPPASVGTLPDVSDLPTEAVVAAETLETFDAPEPGAFSLERLDRGQTLRVVDIDRTTGWLTIAPTDASFAWIDQSKIRPEGPGLARVTANSATLRVGIPGARLPGPVRVELRKGEVVRLLDRPQLRSGLGSNQKTWLAVVPPPADVRYVRSEGVRWPGRAEASSPAERAETLTSFQSTDAPSSAVLPPEIAAEVGRLESEHRAILSGPIESWRLESLRERYQALRARVSDPASVSAIAARQNLVDRHDQMARSARTIHAILSRSRRRDQDVESARRRLAEIERPQRRPFVAEGLVQPSSRLVEGRRVYALIGGEGNPIAYLDIPPGLDASPMLLKRVGVRGGVRYNEALGSKLITVREIEALE